MALKHFPRRIFLLSALVGSWFALTTTKLCAAEPSKPISIVLVGDSTVAEKSGWGPAFRKLVGPGATCTNMAIGGRSSKSYRGEGHWEKVMAAKPDYIIIQFGHNDMPGKGPERETDPATTFRENLIRYVQEARSIGAKSILVTSLTRRVFMGDKIVGELAPWAEATRKVGADKHVPVVDLFARSVALHEKMGPEASAKFNPPSKDKTDRTHLEAKGAAVIAGLVADELRKVAPDVAKLLKK